MEFCNLVETYDAMFVLDTAIETNKQQQTLSTSPLEYVNDRTQWPLVSPTRQANSYILSHSKLKNAKCFSSLSFCVRQTKISTYEGHVLDHES